MRGEEVCLCSILALACSPYFFVRSSSRILDFFSRIFDSKNASELSSESRRHSSVGGTHTHTHTVHHTALLLLSHILSTIANIDIGASVTRAC
jgi:hypothetical protein